MGSPPIPPPPPPPGYFDAKAAAARLAAEAAGKSSSSTQFVIPIVLDLAAHNYYHWCHLFDIHLGRSPCMEQETQTC
jgi:hypothetical protein